MPGRVIPSRADQTTALSRAWTSRTRLRCPGRGDTTRRCPQAAGRTRWARGSRRRMGRRTFRRQASTALRWRWVQSLAMERKGSRCSAGTRGSAAGGARNTRRFPGLAGTRCAGRTRTRSRPPRRSRWLPRPRTADKQLQTTSVLVNTTATGPSPRVVPASPSVSAGRRTARTVTWRRRRRSPDPVRTPTRPRPRTSPASRHPPFPWGSRRTSRMIAPGWAQGAIPTFRAPGSTTANTTSSPTRTARAGSPYTNAPNR